MESVNVVIFARVSTRLQEYDRQLNELRSFAARMQYNIIAEFAEKISGATKISDREALSELLDFCDQNKVDKVLVWECSRLSRRAVDFLSIVEFLTERKVSVYIHQNGLETLLPDGTQNPIANLVLGILAQFNSMERTMIRARMESGFNAYIANGGKVGRKEGYRKPKEQIMSEYSKEISLIRKGISLRNVAAITGTSRGTLSKVKALMAQ